MAAETPMAGAPRTIMSRMTVGDMLVVGREDVGLFEGEAWSGRGSGRPQRSIRG